MSEIISVTFTEKAAGEMKLRLRGKLDEQLRAAANDDERRLLTDALEALEVARISTIHGLCADLLREYPVESGVDPLFEVAADGESDAMLHAAFGREFQKLLRDPPEGVRRVLRRRARGWDAEPPRITLRTAVATLIEHRDFSAPWRRDPFDRDAEVEALLPELQKVGGRCKQLVEKDDSDFCKCLAQVQRFIEDLAHRESVLGADARAAQRDYDGLEALLRELVNDQYRWTKAPWRRTAFKDGVTTDQVVSERAALYIALTQFVRHADADVAALLHQELQCVVAAYEEEKARAGVLDFVDLLLKTRDLVRLNPPVRALLQQRFRRLFVDEFQDTDPLQSEILLLLAADDPNEVDPMRSRPVPGKLFVVGDPKQSIYRFRRADVALYDRVKRHLEGHGAKVVYLSTSFRSTPGIQAAINASFSAAMSGPTQARYVALDKYRERRPEQPSVIALPAPKPNGERGWPTKIAAETGLSEAVGAFVEWLVKKSGWTVEENKKLVPVEARHVCILFKRLRKWGGIDVPRPYAQALEARGVRHVLVGGRSFHVREEVMALRTALWAIERPDDELSIYATLKGPFFAFTDDQLLGFRHEVGSHAFVAARNFKREKLSPPSIEIADALAGLKLLHRERNKKPVASTLHGFLELTRAHAGVAFWTAGAQALANVLQLAELSRRHERRATSFRDVVEALQDEADEGEAPEAPIVEEGTEGVRMMTVHAAKGLEFPVVILAEPTANASRTEPSHWVDPDRGLWVHSLAGSVPSELRQHEAEVVERDREESIRVTYVAATRARELLVVPAIADKKWDDTWTEVLYPAIYPSPASAHAPREAPGCPKFGGDTVLDRQGPMALDTPMPGLHMAQTLKNGVVWWDPAILQLERESKTGLQAANALKDDPIAAPVSERAWFDWQDHKRAAIAAGSVPSAVVRVARELTEPPLPGVVMTESTDVLREGRPRGRRFGELVHASLATVPFDANRSLIEKVVSVQGRALLASSREVAAAVDAVESALRHPLLVLARERPTRRECPILDVLPDETIVEGNIDLAIDDGAQWLVVELKTDDDLTEHQAVYEAQTAAYVNAIAHATGRSARGIILRV